MMQLAQPAKLQRGRSTFHSGREKQRWRSGSVISIAAARELHSAHPGGGGRVEKFSRKKTTSKGETEVEEKRSHCCRRAKAKGSRLVPEKEVLQLPAWGQLRQAPHPHPAAQGVLQPGTALQQNFPIIC